jgi:hypothetical protein
MPVMPDPFRETNDAGWGMPASHARFVRVFKEETSSYSYRPVKLCLIVR